MDKKVKSVISFLEEKYDDEIYDRFPKEKVLEIVINCVSLIKTLFDRADNCGGMSLELNLYDINGDLCETLNGVTFDNVYETISEIFILKNNDYSKISLDGFRYDNGFKAVKNIGEIEIS